MIYSVKIIAVLVQVGTNLWVNPMQVTAVYKTALNGSDCITRVTATNGGFCSDWTVDQVLNAIEKAHK